MQTCSSPVAHLAIEHGPQNWMIDKAPTTSKSTVTKTHHAALDFALSLSQKMESPREGLVIKSKIFSEMNARVSVGWYEKSTKWRP